MTAVFASLAEVEELVRGFEDCTIPKSSWNHCAHLTVAIWYMVHLDEAEATERMIHGIQRYNRSKGIRITPTGGYHETITLFWLSLAGRFVREKDRHASALESINGFVKRYVSRKELLWDYYSRAVLFSPQARHCWVEPDLKPLDTAHVME